MMLGTLTTIRTGTTVAGNLSKQTSATLTISQSHIQGSASAKTSKAYKTLKSWSLEGEMLMTTGEFQSLYGWMIRDSSSTSVLTFRTKYNDTRWLYISGDCTITRLSFKAQGRGIVRLAISAIGSGKPTKELKTS